MKRTATWITIFIIAAVLPLASPAQFFKKPKPSISPADSAAAIKSFMTGTGGSGQFYQYRTRYTFKKNDSTGLDTMSVVITDSHNARTDMGAPGMKMAVLGHAGLPRYSILLYPASRSYLFNIIDTAAINSAGGPTYQVTKIGNETVQGYNCIHSRLTVINSGQKSGITEEVWTSADVPGYTALKKLIALQNVTPKMLQAIEQAGCGGLFVKVEMQTKAFSMEMLLVDAERKNFPASMFQIPPGYTQGTSNY